MTCALTLHSNFSRLAACEQLVQPRDYCLTLMSHLRSRSNAIPALSSSSGPGASRGLPASSLALVDLDEGYLARTAALVEGRDAHTGERLTLSRGSQLLQGEESRVVLEPAPSRQPASNVVYSYRKSANAARRGRTARLVLPPALAVDSASVGDTAVRTGHAGATVAPDLQELGDLWRDQRRLQSLQDHLLRRRQSELRTLGEQQDVLTRLTRSGQAEGVPSHADPSAALGLASQQDQLWSQLRQARAMADAAVTTAASQQRMLRQQHVQLVRNDAEDPRSDSPGAGNKGSKSPGSSGSPAMHADFPASDAVSRSPLPGGAAGSSGLRLPHGGAAVRAGHHAAGSAARAHVDAPVPSHLPSAQAAPSRRGVGLSALERAPSPARGGGGYSSRMRGSPRTSPLPAPPESSKLSLLAQHDSPTQEPVLVASSEGAPARLVPSPRRDGLEHSGEAATAHSPAPPATALQAAFFSPMPPDVNAAPRVRSVISPVDSIEPPAAAQAFPDVLPHVPSQRSVTLEPGVAQGSVKDCGAGAGEHPSSPASASVVGSISAGPVLRTLSSGVEATAPHDPATLQAGGAVLGRRRPPAPRGRCVGFGPPAAGMDATAPSLG